MHTLEKGRKYTPRKMTERKLHDTENGRTEIARHGKWQKSHTLENGRKYTPRKMHDTENDRTEKGHSNFRWLHIFTYNLTIFHLFFLKFGYVARILLGITMAHSTL